MKNLLAVLFLSALLVGCAGRQIQVKNVNSPDINKGFNLLIEPYEAVGIKVTPEIKSGRIQVKKGIFPDVLFGEYFPGRIRWNGWAVEPDGREYFAQSIFTGIDFSGHFSERTIVDARASQDARVMNFSSLIAYAYSLTGTEFSLKFHKILNDVKYRKDFILKYGTRLGDLQNDQNFVKIISKWNLYNSPNGQILSPIGEKQLKEIAGINPEYTFVGQLVGSGRFMLTPDYIGTIVSLGIDVFCSADGSIPSKGWDYNSQLPNRRQMALIIRYIGKFRMNLIKRINDVNRSLLMRGGILQ